MNVIIIGSGNVAFHLAKAFHKNGVKIVAIQSRNKKEGKKLAEIANCPFVFKLSDLNHHADFYLICVSDDSIRDVVNDLPDAIKENRIVAHTSGSKSIGSTLASCVNPGVFYPLQSFSKNREIDYARIPICVNGISENVKLSIKNLALKISSSVHEIDEEQRKVVHTAAVFINNFVNHLIYISEEILGNEDVDKNILLPLLEETLKKQMDIGSFAAQTGPARRGDKGTIKAHLDLLSSNPKYQEVYKALTNSISDTYKTIP